MFSVRTHTFSDNKKSEYEANELQTWNLDAFAQSIKLDFEAPYDNEYNKTKKIGIRAIKIMGLSIAEFVKKYPDAVKDNS